jgi:hypothetical protein
MTILLPLATALTATRTGELPELASMALIAVVLAGVSVVLQRTGDRLKHDRAERGGASRPL